MMASYLSRLYETFIGTESFHSVELDRNPKEIEMSGESGRPAKSVQGQRVKPEPVHEKSFVENVAGFINEVVPQTYNNPAHYEGKERITWVRFDHCDINDLSQFRDGIECNGNAPPFLLLIGYSNGVQAWVIPANGEAVEVFSWRHGPVRTLKILVTPNISDTLVDRFSLKRPILAICDAAGIGPKFHSVSFISLKTGDQVKTIKFHNPVQDIYSNKNVVVVSFPEKLAIFEATTFEDMFTISTCYRCPGLSINPIALGDQWLAFADRRLYSIHQSCGGVVPEGSSSYKSTVIYAAKSITKGLKEFGETVASNFMGPKVSSSQPQAPAQCSSTPGVVTIIDTQRVNGNEVNLGGGSCPELIAHFVAHQNVPIVALAFDASGMLLATADKLGHNFNVFRIQPHPLSSAQAAIHHLYTLYRGDTTAKVMDISFSLDSRWIAVSTHRGTTHVYPITPYGGSIGMRTHKSVCVVNRLSRFQRSAGLDDAPSSGRNSPVLSTSPGVSKLAFEPSPNLAYLNPRYPPYPSPVTLKPLAQLRQPLLQNLIESIAPGPSPSHSPPSNKSSKVAGPEQIVKVASIFGATRGWLAGSPTVPREIKRHSVDSLFVMAYHGNLIEYYLEPKPIPGLPQEKITEDSPISLEVHASAQWSLVRESTSYEIRPPLPSTSPLLLSREKNRPRSESPAQSRQKENPEDKWMAQVEIYTHAGPPRRLWMGPQFTFKSLPGTGHLAGDQTSSETFTDPSLAFPYRSSPVNMPGVKYSSGAVFIEASSLTGSHSPRTDRLSMESDHYDPENVMSRLRSDLADAMLDTPHISSSGHKRDSGGGLSDSPTGDDQGFDFSDIMDISCDPPGPSSIGTNSSLQDVPMPMQEEQIQAVTAKLHQVAVTSQPGVTAECVSPFYGSRTPSLEECKVLTSSAEELASTLDCPRVEEHNVSSFAWIPIDPPKPASQTTSIKKPEPLDRRDSPKGVWGRRVETFSNDDVTLKPSWNVADDILSQNNNNNHLSEDAFPPIIGGVSKSATTSEDDLWTAKEGNRKDRRRKKRKNRTEEGNDEVLFTSASFPAPKHLSPSSSPILHVQQNPSPSFEIELDNFQTAEEFHDPLESSPLHINSPRKEALLKSIHEGDDLARALEEASSDEGNVPVKATVGNVKGEADEMFPFRDSSSDEDEGRITVRVRRRNVLLSHNHSLNDEEDDDRDTSGDDRKTTTSESDATTSPNPKNSMSSKGKKKKKKKK